MNGLTPKQLTEVRRLNVLLIQAVNKAEECIGKLKRGFIEPADEAETRKKIEHLHTEVMEIDDQANELLNGEGNCE